MAGPVDNNTNLAPAGATPDLAPTPGGLPPILLAEDDTVTRMLMTKMLRRAGHEVVAVNDGAAALAALEKRYFPLLLTDWEMPELDGVGLCRAVRERSFPGYVYTVLLTSRDTHEHIVAGLEAGADDYLTKPANEAELMARLKTGMRILDLERNLRAATAEAERLAVTDPLTGAYNRRHLMTRLPHEVERARRYGKPLAVVLCDIDHFKKVNDTYGHHAGDEVLRAFVRYLHTETRAGIDWCARYGGEEFVIVLPETDVDGAMAAAEKLRQGAAALVVPSGEGRNISFTSSFGVCIGHGADSPDAEGLVARADLGLYASKEGGRNRITLRR